MSDCPAPISVVADRFEVASAGLRELTPVEQGLILWTVLEWARKEFDAVMPLIVDKPDVIERA